MMDDRVQTDDGRRRRARAALGIQGQGIEAGKRGQQCAVLKTIETARLFALLDFGPEGFDLSSGYTDICLLRALPTFSADSLPFPTPPGAGSFVCSSSTS